MQSRVSARVVGRFPVECNRFVFHRNFSTRPMSQRLFHIAECHQTLRALISPTSPEKSGRSIFYGLRAQCADVCYTRPKGLKAKKQSNNSNENREEVKISFI